MFDVDIRRLLIIYVTNINTTYLYMNTPILIPKTVKHVRRDTSKPQTLEPLHQGSPVGPIVVSLFAFAIGLLSLAAGYLLL